MIVEGRLGAQPNCPRCGGDHVVRNGHADGLQRYKCRSCSQTFNALTGTPLARLRQRGKWLAQARALADGLSVRGAAAQIGVHRTTAFRWRHRFLQLPATVRATALAGVAEGDESYTLRSYKGQPRRLRAEQTRAPRWRAVRRPSAACPTNKCRPWSCATVSGKRPTTSSRAATPVTSPPPCSRSACRRTRSFVRMPAPHSRPQPGPRGLLMRPSTPPAASVAATPGISRTSTPITVAGRPGWFASTGSPPPTSNTTSAGSAPSTAIPNGALRTRRCSRSPSAHEGILR